MPRLAVAALAVAVVVAVLPMAATASEDSTIVLPDGWTVDIAGTDCSDRTMAASHESAVNDTTPTTLQFHVGDDCEPVDLTVVDTSLLDIPSGTDSVTSLSVVDQGADSGEVSISATRSHNYHHAYTYLTDIDPIEAMTAEFETVSGRWWDGTYAWWYDPNCCAGWDYAIARTWFGWWSPSQPVINPVDKDNCRSTGPCTKVRNNFKEVYTLTWPWCFGSDRKPTVKHNHVDTKSGGVLTFFYYENLCFGLNYYSQDWANGNKYGDQVKQ